jgi:hypothetical protein
VPAEYNDITLYPENPGTGREQGTKSLIPTKLNGATSQRTAIFLIYNNDDYYKNYGSL